MGRLGLFLLLCLAPWVMRAESPGNGWPDLSIPAPFQGGGEKDAALIIGISDYAFLSDIPGAAENAKDWATYLTKTRGLDPARVFLLTDGDAYLEPILSKLEAAVASTREGGTLWVIYIGHGYGGQLEDKNHTGFLVGSDAKSDRDTIKSRSLSQDALFKALNKGKQAQTTVVLDACFSGKTPDGNDLVDDDSQVIIISTDPEQSAKRQASKKKIVILTASQAEQLAGPLPAARRPAFSYLVLGSLRGWADQDGNKDGNVTIEEIIDYSKQTILQRKRIAQTPSFKGLNGTSEKTVLAKGDEPKPSPDYNAVPVGANSGGNVTPGKENPTTAPPEKLVEYTKVKLTSTPEGAEIFVDNRSQGLTPLELLFPKEEKTINVKLRRDGFEDQSDDVSLLQNYEKTFALKELPKPVDPAEKIQKMIFSTALGAGALTAAVFSPLITKGIEGSPVFEGNCSNGAEERRDVGGGLLSGASGVFAGAAWWIQKEEESPRLVPMLGASATAFAVSGFSLVVARCPKNEDDSPNSINDPQFFTGVALLSASAIDFALWAVMRSRGQDDAEPKTAFFVSPTQSGALLQLQLSF